MNTIKLYVIGCLIAPLFLASACKKDAKDPETIRTVFYQRADAHATTQETILPGIVAFNQEAKLSFKSGGVISDILVKEGQKVDKESLLAVIDNRDYQVQVRQAIAGKEGSIANQKAAEAQVEKAKSTLASSKSNYLRTEKLYLNNHVSLAEYENAKSQYESAKAALNTAKAQNKAALSQIQASNAQVSASQNQLDYTRLYAPSNGTVSQVLMEENEMVGAGIPVMVLSSQDDLVVKSVVPELWIDRIKHGKEVTIELSSLNKTTAGEIIEITPKTPTNTGYPIKVSFKEHTTGIKPGMSAKVKIPLEQASDPDHLIIIDTDAVSKDVDGHFVYVLDEEENDLFIARRRSVEVGTITKNGYIITEGLKNDELVITAGTRFLYDGMTVKIQEAANN